jgi:hypothetical protein
VGEGRVRGIFFRNSGPKSHSLACSNLTNEIVEERI